MPESAATPPPLRIRVAPADVLDGLIFGLRQGLERRLAATHKDFAGIATSYAGLGSLRYAAGASIDDVVAAYRASVLAFRELQAARIRPEKFQRKGKIGNPLVEVTFGDPPGGSHDALRFAYLALAIGANELAIPLAQDMWDPPPEGRRKVPALYRLAYAVRALVVNQPADIVVGELDAMGAAKPYETAQANAVRALAARDTRGFENALAHLVAIHPASMRAENCLDRKIVCESAAGLYALAKLRGIVDEAAHVALDARFPAALFAERWSGAHLR